VLSSPWKKIGNQFGKALEILEVLGYHGEEKGNALEKTPPY
jgi:hypothetical protein